MRCSYLFLALMALTCSHAHASGLIAQKFQPTISDVNFDVRLENAASGYAPFRDAKMHSSLVLTYTDEELTQAVEDMQPLNDVLAAQRANDVATLTHDEYCKKYPLEEQCSPTDEMIYKAFKPQHITGGGAVVSKNNIHDGPCTPSAKSSFYPSKIYTSGAHASDAAFNKAMNTVFRAEGECAHERKSINSITCYGLTQRYNPEINVRTITRAQAEDHTYKKYYRTPATHTLPDVIRGEVFHVNFWTGSYGTRLLRRLLNVNPTRKDTTIEPELVAAADNYSGDLFADYMYLVDQHVTLVAKRIYEREHVDYRTNYAKRIQLMRENGCHVPTKNPIN